MKKNHSRSCQHPCKSIWGSMFKKQVNSEKKESKHVAVTCPPKMQQDHASLSSLSYISKD